MRSLAASLAPRRGPIEASSWLGSAPCLVETPVGLKCRVARGPLNPHSVPERSAAAQTQPETFGRDEHARRTRGAESAQAHRIKPNKHAR
eukprot:7125719-Pyramimonas_sp.AAC.1